jgi:hypothetical protein
MGVRLEKMVGNLRGWNLDGGRFILLTVIVVVVVVFFLFAVVIILKKVEAIGGGRDEVVAIMPSRVRPSVSSRGLSLTACFWRSTVCR